MAKKRWQYCSANGGSHGTMICTACRKLVTEGEYRVYETEEAFHVQHRSCSKSDPKWAELDARQVNYVEATKARLAAYIAFRDEWNESALNEEIEDMQAYLKEVAEFEKALNADADAPLAVHANSGV
jgi:hypothetical protein